MITVTKTFLPPISEYQQILQRAWDNQWLTNRGELLLELEQKLKDRFELSGILITNNGTIPLQIALKLLGKGGEIITTPFSYVATTSSIIWEHCKPVFVDVHPEYFTIDETRIREAITPATTAILATHVFGNPCDVDTIETIAKEHGLSVIYDAAHCFGVSYKGKSIFKYGDVSTCSFHATKIFHTSEGGAIFCEDPELMHQMYYSHNFGHNGPLDFHGLGINGKISELQAAMGLAMLPYMEEILSERKAVVDFYNRHLDFKKLTPIRLRENTDWNYSYYPILFENEAALEHKMKDLAVKGIIPRRYFYPSLNKLPYVSYVSMPVSEDIASRIACLPLYVGLQKREQELICSILNS